MVSAIVNGEYKGWGIKMTLSGKVVAQQWSKKVVLDNTTIESYEVIDKAEGKSSIGKTIGLGAIFGVAGAIAGASSKKAGKTTIKINWKDGKKSIAELDASMFKAFMRVCPL